MRSAPAQIPTPCRGSSPQPPASLCSFVHQMRLESLGGDVVYLESGNKILKKVNKYSKYRAVWV